MQSGTILVGEDDCTGRTAREYIDEGVGHIPEDRQRRGLVLEFSLAENLALTVPRPAGLALRLAPAGR